MGHYDDYIELENPGELTGVILRSSSEVYDTPFLAVDNVAYDITFTENLSGFDLAKLVGKEITVTVERISRAGMIAPELGHLLVSQISYPESTPAP